MDYIYLVEFKPYSVAIDYFATDEDSIKTICENFFKKYHKESDIINNIKVSPKLNSVVINYTPDPRYFSGIVNKLEIKGEIIKVMRG
jgi:hypothetical protein